MNLFYLLSFIGTAILLTLAPGPDIMYLLARSLHSGPREGIPLAAGLSTGPIFHTTLVAVGVAAFIQNSPTAFTIMKCVGAAYLLYLAWKAFRAVPKPLSISGEVEETARSSLFLRGVLMNISNPKVLLFFLALLPQFIDPNGSLSAGWQIMILGLSFSLQAFIVFSLISLCAGKVRNYLVHKKNFPLIMNRVEGCVLTLIAAGMLFL
jgi:threonine/homoserine/homoserine lactone efflux protein